jgi:asparagine synthase (glutamine-hydrolysing)
MHITGFVGVADGAEPPALADYLRRLSAANGASQDPRCSAQHVAIEGGITVALQGNPIWPADGPTAAPVQPAARVLAEYRREGARFLQNMHGAFAVAILDDTNRSALIAVDRMGIERMAFAVRAQTFVFSSSCELIARAPSVNANVRPQALFDYLLLHMVPAPTSAYDGVQKLQAGSCARFAGGKVAVERYWRPAFVESGGAARADLERELHAALRTAIERCAPDDRTGAFLSGGLDSSSVAGMLSKVVPRRARTFSIGFGVDAYNELDFARIAARHFQFDATEYHVTAADIVEAFPLIAAAYDEPFGNSSAVPTYFCAKLAAQHGVTHLLAGDGGDEIFGGNERYARQRVFESYGTLPGFLRRRVLEPLVAGIDPESALVPLRKLRSYVDQAKIRLPERLECWNYMYRADLDAMLEPDFRAAIDPRSVISLMTETYDAAQSDSLLNRMLHYDWQFTLSDNDLRKVATMCRLADVRVSYPMLDPAVIDVSVRVPPQLKMEGAELRSFYKRAMRNFLPQEILNKTKHGFGLPFGVWLQTHPPLADMIFSFLTDLKQRRIIRGRFLDALIAEQRSEHPEYSGYAIWDLAMLEAWFQAHRSVTSV